MRSHCPDDPAASRPRARPTGPAARPPMPPRSSRLRRASLHAAGAAVVAAAWLGAAAHGGPTAQRAQGAPAAARGQALYETRCVACHDRSVHRRESRQAGDFDALRREVARWSANAGADWRADEIDAVSGYLNDRYYRFPCPASVCPPAPRARIDG